MLIPTIGRAEKLARCLTRLANQTLDRSRFEVLVGVDGRADGADPDRGDREAADAAQALAERTAGSMRAVVHQFEHAGPGATRNRLVEHARGELILMLNDDVLPEPELLEAHVREHARWRGPAMVLGAAPWVVPGEDTLFDRLIRETSMVFFYDRMKEMLEDGRADADHDWGFRHAWTLNLSLPRRVFAAVGGFDERLTRACYEDIEFGYRVWKSCGAPVRYASGAVVRHDHRIMPEDYLRRERMMGAAARVFAEASPLCAMEVFGRDIRSREEVEYSRAFVERERGAAMRLRETFAGWAKVPSTAIDGPHAGAMLRGLYEHHLLLKRWVWRSGLLDAGGA
ncbi:MAG: glycosyltransferase family 2 protein [Phycisphaerales bacterium]